MEKKKPIDLKKAWKEHLKKIEEKKKNGEAKKHS